jgi:hypothetical protein
MTPISIKIKRMARLPRHHRIGHLKALILELPVRSIRRKELEHLLREEMTAQLKKENAA